MAPFLPDRIFSYLCQPRRLKRLVDWVWARYWVGVRPEHLKIQRDNAAITKNVIQGRVEVVEPQGSTTIIQLSVGGDIRLIALINEQVEPEPGSALALSVASDAIYLFDPATDRSI